VGVYDEIRKAHEREGLRVRALTAEGQPAVHVDPFVPDDAHPVPHDALVLGHAQPLFPYGLLQVGLIPVKNRSRCLALPLKSELTGTGSVDFVVQRFAGKQLDYLHGSFAA
jgi:hypothetical protein